MTVTANAFESFEDIFTLQEKIVDDDAEVAQTARNIAMCGARASDFDSDTLGPRFTSLLGGILHHVLDNPPSAIWNPNLPGFNDGGSSSLLFASKSNDGSLTFSILAMPEHLPTPNSFSIFGLLNDQAFTRTSSFDIEGISNGAIRFTELNFASKSPPNRLRFTTSSCPLSTRASLRKALVVNTTNSQGKASKNHSNFYALSSGQKFHECGTSEGMWTRESSREGVDFEFVLPAYLPLPHGHNLTIVKPVSASDPSPDFIQAALISAGVKPDSDTSWFVENPIFQAWHAAMLSNADHSTPTSTSSINFSSIQDKATYKACLSCLRRVSSDWLKEVESQPIVFDSLLADPSLSLQDMFPPEGITCAFTLPDSDPPHLVLAPIQPNPPAGAPNPPILALPNGGPIGQHQNLHQQGPAILLNSFQQATSSEFPFSSSTSSATKRANINSRRTWQIYGLIDHKERSREEKEVETSLTASIDNLTLWTPNLLSGTTSPLVPQKTSFYLASPLHGNFLSILDTKATQTTAKDMASSFKSNFLNFLDNSGKRFSHNLQAEKSRFFCGDIFLWVMNSTLYQRSLRKDTDLDRFSLLHICLLHDQVLEGDNHNPIFPESGFDSFEDIKAIVETMKWFLTNIFHRDHYKATIIYKGLEFLIEECEKKHFNYVWKNTESFSKSIATYILIHSIHNLGSLAAAMASNVSEDAAYQAFLSIPSNPDPSPCLLSPPKLTDPSFSTNMFDTTSTWLSTLASHLELCGSYDNHDCLKSGTNSEITIAISNHCMFSNKKRKTDPRPKETNKTTDHGEKKTKRPKKEGPTSKDGKPTVADPGTNLLRPASKLSIADVLEKAKNPQDPFKLPKVMKGTVTGFDNNCRLCFNFLLGGTCTEQKCGYHLFRSKNMYGTHEEWQFMRNWLEEEKGTVRLSEEAYSNSKWAKTYSD